MIVLEAEDVRMKIWTGLSIVAALFVVFPAEASAADWVYVSSSNSADRYVDRTSIKQVGPYKRAWFRNVYINDPVYENQIILFEFDCAGGRAREIQMTTYYKSGKSNTVGGRDWQYVSPDTARESIFNYVCFGKLDY
jgi:hypothetical protein